MIPDKVFQQLPLHCPQRQTYSVIKRSWTVQVAIQLSVRLSRLVAKAAYRHRPLSFLVTLRPAG